MLQILQTVDPAIRPAAVTALATALSAFFGFGGVIISIFAQGRLSRRSIAENERRKLKAAMYEESLLITRSMSDAAIELSNHLSIMLMQIRQALQAAADGQSYNLPAARFPDISARYAAFADAAIKLILLIEGRVIVDQRLLVFRSAFSSVLHDTRELMYFRLVEHLLPNLPVDNPQGGTFPYQLPSLQQAETIAVLVVKFGDALGDAVAYGDDLLIELQNALLGDLFKSKLPSRKPLDPSRRAIVLDKHRELEQWFRTETSWGKHASDVTLLTIESFSNQPRK
jgi:hypothetical protein